MDLKPEIGQVIKILDDYFKKNNISFVLIGALVPLFMIDFKEKNGVGYGIRPTYDIDYSALVNSWSEYRRIKQELIARGFKAKKSEPEHRLFFNDVAVDIIPYGDNLLEHNILVWPKSGHQMNMVGFDIVFQHAQQLKVSETLTISTIPIFLSVYTKMIALLDRHSQNDLMDIFYMLNHYEEVSVSNRRFDLFEIEGIYYENSGAYLVGVDLKKVLSPQMFKSILGFFNFIDDPDNTILYEIARKSNQKPLELIDLIMAFKKGLGIEL